MDTLKHYTLAAVGNQEEGGTILLGPDAQVYGSIAASDTIGLGDGVAIAGDACGHGINGADKELQNISGKYGPCDNIGLLRQEINQLSDALDSAGTQKGDLQGSYTLGSGVYHVNNFILGRHDTLNLRGESGQRTVINVHGNAQMDAGSKVMLTGGLQPQDVFFNFVHKEQYNSFEFGGATLVGTYISNGRTFIMGDGATLQNARFYTTGNIIADVELIRFDETPLIPFIQPAASPLEPQAALAVSSPWTSLFFVFFCLAAWRMRQNCNRRK